MRILVAILFVGQLAFLGCTLSPRSTRALTGRVEMRQAIFRGCQDLENQKDVVSFLVSEGFRCQFIENGAFDDNIGPVENGYDPLTYGGTVLNDHESRVFRNKNYVYGQRTDQSTFPTDRVWHIAVVLNDDGSPTDAFVYTQHIK